MKQAMAARLEKKGQEGTCCRLFPQAGSTLVPMSLGQESTRRCPFITVHFHELVQCQPPVSEQTRFLRFPLLLKQNKNNQVSTQGRQATWSPDCLPQRFPVKRNYRAA